MKPQVSLRDEINGIKQDISELGRAVQLQASMLIAIANAADHIVKTYWAVTKKDEPKAN
jgi:hypothetical protein